MMKIFVPLLALLPFTTFAKTDSQRRLGGPEYEDEGRQIVSTGALDPRTVETKPKRSRRRFISYRSSEWEQMWIENIDIWTKDRAICDVLLGEQAQIVHDYLNLLCTSRMPPPYSHWCVIDDEFHPLWYNSGNRDEFELSFERPLEIDPDTPVPRPWPVRPGPQHDHLVSRFIFLDEISGDYTVEYIEPLISHLRFPLAKCLEAEPQDQDHKYHYVTFRGWVIPPPPVVKAQQSILFDAGSSTWQDGTGGGPSLDYLTKMWSRHGVDFDSIYAYDWTVTHDDFYRSVPDGAKQKVHYRQVEIASSAEGHNDDHPFVPLIIDGVAKEEDYVVFKLDIDSPAIEDGTMLALLNDFSNKVDEVIWEHHVRGNYLMSSEWLEAVADLSLRNSYEYFLRLREKGIRAHSWV